ncbi:MAG TPA: MOSC domain-containing protein [Arcobacter sp.]|nr:MOSC domain-containing protein [Arcobacter sp.]
MNKKNIGNVLELYISIIGKDNRVKKEKIYFQDGGIQEDKFFNKDAKREILLSSLYSYELALNNNINLEYGVLGENILMDYNPYQLKIGTKLQIGEVIFQISMNCPMCKYLSKVKSTLPQLLKNDRGIFAKVIQEGFVSKEDNIYLLEQ